MKTVSTAFKTELNNDNRHYIKSCDITLADGTKLSVDNTLIWNNGFKFEDDVSNSGSFDIGSAIIGKFTLTLNNIYDDFSEYDFTGAEITNVKVGLELPDGTIESVKEGVFTVDEPTYNGSIITLECLDNMSKFDRPYSESNLIYPATLGAIVRDACSCCGVSLAADSASFDGYDTVIQDRPDGDDSYTFRQVLSWVGQISCHWCRCNENGELSLGWYDTDTLENLTEGKYHDIHSYVSPSICTDDVVITGVRIVVSSGDTDVIYQSGTDGYVLVIEDNKLIQGDAGSAVAANLGEKLIGLQFRPLSLSCLSDPSIEAGDVAVVTDRKGKTYKTLITSTTFQAGNYQKISCDAETPSRNSAARFSKATQIYRELRKSLAKQKSEWKKAVEDLGSKLGVTSGLYSTIQKQEDGSNIYFLHDKSTLEESMIVWKMTSQAWGVSTDGGKTWNGGMTVDGDTITRILSAIGINADWIDTGAFVVKDSDGNILFRADCDTGRVDIVADSFSLKGKTVGEIAQEKLSDFVSSVYNSDIASLQAQIDGQIETFYYDYEPTLNNIPASQWTTEEDRQKHEGDLFYWKSKGYAYRFFKDGSTWKWQLVRDTDVTKALADAAEAQDTADSKRRVFITTPVPPYDEGDLWVQGSGGDIMRCQTERKSGNYVSSDWVKASKYTDDSALNAFINGDFKSQIEELEKQNDKKAETWRQSTDPSTSWTTSEIKSEHTGDLWYNTSTQKYYRWSGTSWEEMKAQPPDAVFDSIDGKAQIFVSQPKPPYDKGDLWVTSTTNGEAGIKICTTSRASGSYVSSDWIDTKYVDSSSVDSKIKAYDTSLGQTEVFNKLTNGGADQGIYIKDGKLYVNASYILAGMLAGKYINAKGITVKDKDNNVTLSIDDNGNVTLRVSSFSLQGKSIQAIADSSAGTALESAKEYTLEQIEGIQGITGNLIKGYNLTSDDIASYWDTAGTLTYGYDDPAGGKMAVRLYGSTSDNFISANRSKNQVLYATGRYTFSVWLKSDAARTIKISLNRVTYTCSVTTSWKRFSFTANVSSIQSSYQLFTIGGWSSIGSGAYVYAYHPEVTFEFSAEEYFNILTNNGATQGIYFKDGKIYINAAYIDTGNLAGWVIDKANELIRSKNGTIILDAKNNKITTTTGGNGYKTEITAGEVSTGKTDTGELQAGLGKLGTNSTSYIEIGDEFNGENSELCINGKILVNKDYMKLYSIKQVSSSSLIAFASDGATISWVSSSSKRYKDIGQELTEEDIEDMYDIPVVWAKYKDGYLDETDERCGKYMPMFIAEDVDRVFPIAADHKDGKTENWNFRVMIPIMFQMLKSQKKEIEKLKKMLK